MNGYVILNTDDLTTQLISEDTLLSKKKFK
jgi:hypothetical protein